MGPQQDEERGLDGVPLTGDESVPLLSTVDSQAKNRIHHSDSTSKSSNFETGIENVNYKRLLGAAYMLAMGMCGVVLVALGSTLQELAENTGNVSTDIGSVFIARGFGAIFGAIFSAKLYHAVHGNTVITWTILAMCASLLWLPFVSRVLTLHAGFLLLGICTAITDTGCQIMTRRVHGKSAGPWLGANTVAFGLSGAIVPCIAYATTELIVQYAIMSGIGVLAAATFILLPAPENQDGYIAKSIAPPPKAGKSAELGLIGFFYLYRMEVLVGFMVFWLVGGKVGATAYLTQYVAETKIISEDHTSALIAVLWIAITVGRLSGIQIQRNITLPRLFSSTSMLFIGGATGAMLPIVLPRSMPALWVGTAIYGLLNGPTVGFCYDLNNRTTAPSETGMSIVMFGLNCGASFIPFAISGMWDAFQWPTILFVFVMASHILPYPAMLTMKSMHDKILKKATI
jgi:hypothetical protein